MFTWWIHNCLGKGIRTVVPACAVARIRKKYPEESGIYVPFEATEN